MESTAFDGDKVLTDFLTDYLDGNLSKAERNSFEAYLAKNKKEKNFARKAMKGKKALSRLRGRIRESSSSVLNDHSFSRV